MDPPEQTGIFVAIRPEPLNDDTFYFSKPEANENLEPERVVLWGRKRFCVLILDRVSLI
jgi:hypothetical protein